MTDKPVKFDRGDVVHLKNGEDVLVTDVINKAGFYGRLVYLPDLKPRRFRVVRTENIDWVHPKTPTLFNYVENKIV